MLKLNLGCGPHTMKGWVNIDLMDHPDIIKHDLSRGLPTRFVNKNSVDYIFTEHFIEHIETNKAIALLSECHYSLKPDGVLRLSTPDLAFLVECYRNKETAHWAPTWNPRNACAMMNEGMRLWGHQYLYDKEELEFILKEVVEFREIYWVEHRKSFYKELNGLEVRPYVNDLIVECVK